MTVRRRLLKIVTSNRGVVMVEFAVAAPVFILAMCLIVDFGYILNSKIKLVNAVTAAAEYAMAKDSSFTSSTFSDFYKNIKSIATSTVALPSSQTPTVTVSYNNAADGSSANYANYYCLTGYPPTWTPMGTSSVSCGGSSPIMAGKFVTITMSTSVPSFFGSDKIFGKTFALTDTATVRVK